MLPLIKITSTDKIANTLMLYVVNTGLLTSVCAVCSLIAVCPPVTPIFLCWHETLISLLQCRTTSYTSVFTSISRNVCYWYARYQVNLTLRTVYFVSLLATLNARERFREGTMNTSDRNGSYQMSRIVNLRSPFTSKNAGSLGVGSAKSDSLEKIGLEPRDKVRPCRIFYGAISSWFDVVTG